MAAGALALVAAAAAATSTPALRAYVRLYRRHLSHTLFADRRCPMTPTCSTYALQALHRHPRVNALELIAARLKRCSRTAPGPARVKDPVPAPIGGAR